jgi:hypothetical protein
MLRNQCIAYLVCSDSQGTHKMLSLAMLQHMVYIVTTVFRMVRHHVYFEQEMATQQMGS